MSIVGATFNHKQYSTSEKLAARARLHANYTVGQDTPWFAWVAARAGLAPGERVLDAGCGPGWFWAAAAESMPDHLDITLVDLSPGMVGEASKRLDEIGRWTVRGVVADLAALPFEDASFDVVIALHMLYHLPDPAAGIAEIFRVLKPGGRVVVTTNGSDNLRGLYALGATAFGTPPVEPVAALFGFDKAESMLRAQFGAVTHALHPGRLRITEPEDVFMAQTSFPPGDSADEAQLIALRTAIADAFARGGGVLEVAKQTGAFMSRKAG